MTNSANTPSIRFSSPELARFIKLGGDRWLYELLAQGSEMRLCGDKSDVSIDMGQTIREMHQQQANPAQ